MIILQKIHYWTTCKYLDLKYIPIKPLKRFSKCTKGSGGGFGQVYPAYLSTPLLEEAPKSSSFLRAYNNNMHPLGCPPPLTYELKVAKLIVLIP